MKTTPYALTTGLKYHCENCNIAIPSDAPRPTESDCADVVRSKLTWFNPDESPAAQFLMATSAWTLIHRKALETNSHPESTEYHRQFKTDRKSHYAGSLMKKSLSDEQVATALTHKRDKWLYS